MPWTRPALTDIVSRIINDVASRLGLPDLSRRSVEAVLCRALAGAVHLLHGFQAWMARQLFVDTAEEEFLARHAAVWGVTRKAAARASGAVTFTGTDGVVIPSGTEIQSADEVSFLTQADATIASGTAEAEALAVSAGDDGNLDAGAALSLVTSIAGVQSTATADDGMTGGLDEEDDESLRARLLARIQAPPHGGNAEDYEQWALEVPGVTRAWPYPQYLGPGTVGLTFVCDDQESGPIPDQDKVDEVAAYIETVRPVTADVTVFAPTAVDVDFTITVDPDTSAVRAAVEVELRDLIDRVGEPGGTLRLSHVREAVSTAVGEEDSIVTVPAADTTFGAGEMPVFGTITWG